MSVTPPSTMENLPPTDAIGKVVVVSGPSGVGKGTMLRSLLSIHPDLYMSISATTRGPRSGEMDGKDYYFVDRPQFEAWIATDKLLEWAEYAGNLYGTPRDPVLEQLNQGKTVILEIELDGARQVRHTFPDALQVFILPPLVRELEDRLKSRSQDTPEAIAKRLNRARIELDAADEFDVKIVNDALEEAIATLEQVLFPSH